MEQIVVGKLKREDSRFHGVVVLSDGREILVEKQFLGHAQDQELVAVSLEKKANGRFYGRVIQCFDRKMAGEVRCFNGDYVISIHGKKHAYQVPILKLGACQGEDVVWFEMIEENNQIGARVLYVLGSKDEVEVDSVNYCREQGIHTVFPNNVLRAARKKESFSLPPLHSSRVDLRDKFIFTIDGEDSKDLDDAIGLEILANGNYCLRVNIADVSEVIETNSVIDMDAQKRGNSVYLVGKVYPMLPPVISNQVCSLNPCQERDTVTCEIELCPDGTVVTSKLLLSRICSRKKMSYENVNQVLSGACPYDYEAYQGVLQHMDALAQQLYLQRKNKGAIEFETMEPVVALTDGEVTNIFPRMRGKSQRMIQEFMILANEQVAEILANYHLAAPYRNHTHPRRNAVHTVVEQLYASGYDCSHLLTLENYKSSYTFQNLLQKYELSEIKNPLHFQLASIMKRAIYTSEPKGHFALGLSHYVHFTSPIRRYPDLLVHRVIKNHLLLGKCQFQEEIEQIENLGAHCSDTLRNADRCELFDLKQRALTYYRSHIDTVYQGQVINCSAKGILLQLEIGTQEFLPASMLSSYQYDPSTNSFFSYPREEIQLGSYLNVQLKGVKGEKGLAVFELVEASKQKVKTFL